MTDAYHAPQDAESAINGVDQQVATEYYRCYRQLNSGANWFYWIAGLSLVNSVINFFGQKVSFVIGLGTTQVIDEIARGFHGPAKIFTLLAAIICCGMYVLFGKFSTKRKHWVLVTGLVLYLLDGTIFIFVKDFWSLAFHAYAAYNLFLAVKANRRLGELDRATAALHPEIVAE